MNKKIYLILPLFLVPYYFITRQAYVSEIPENVPKGVIIFDRETARIAEAIKEKETGGNCKLVGKDGERGCYQTMDGTYRALTKKHLGEVKGFSTTTQELVVYKEIEELRMKNISPRKIFLYWNSGSYSRPCKRGHNTGGNYYDSCSYADRAMEIYNRI